MDTNLMLGLGWQAWLSIAVMLATFLGLALTRLSADVVFVGGLSVLLVSQVLTPKEALTGFSSEGVATVAVLYVIVTGLKDTGGLSWITQRVLGMPKSDRAALLRLMLPVTGVSAFLNNTPVVALFIPVVLEWSRRIRVPPSRLLIPLSFASLLGGTCTLIGTSTNLVVNSMVQQRYQDAGLGLFTIAPIGLPLAVLGILFLVLFPRLLPNRKAFEEIVANPREYTLEMMVTSGGSMDNRTIEAAGLRHLPGAYLAELIRDDRVITAVGPEEVLRANDRLVFVGNIDSLKSLYSIQDLRPATDQVFKLDQPRHQRILVEAVVSNTCPLVGRSIRQGRFREAYNAVVVAVARNGERVAGRIGDIVLRPGDTLLVEANAGFIPRQKDSRDFYLVNAVQDSSPKRFEKAPLALGILVAMVLAASVGGVNMLQAALAASALMLVTGCCSPTAARRSIEWEVLLTIGAAFGLGAALEKTGAARVLAGSVLGITGGDPWITLAMVYLVTSLFTELITNNAAAVLVFPIAMNAVEKMGVSETPFILCIMLAASSSFATPIGYQTNLMVYGPGGYRFGDYLRVGIPLKLLLAAATILLLPVLWPFHK